MMFIREEKLQPSFVFERVVFDRVGVLGKSELMIFTLEWINVYG